MAGPTASPNEHATRSPIAGNLLMDTRRLLFALLGASILTSACERATSLGAARQHADAAMDADTADGPHDAGTDADAATPAEELCSTSGGTVTTSTYCTSVVAPFPNTCSLVGTCSPANSHTIATCTCPMGECFSPGLGCVTQ